MAELQLDTLESKGLIKVASIQPELEYLFRHALVQDAAYESLLKQERRTLHRMVGAALEHLYPERHGELAAVLARHFEHAGETDKAIEYLVAAARFAYDRNGLGEAYELYSRAEALLPPASLEDSPELRHRRVDIGYGRVRAGFSFLGDEESLRLTTALLDEADRLGDPRLAADLHMHAALLRMYGGERADTSPDLKRSLDKVTEIADQLGDPLIGALPKSIIGLFQVFTGDLVAGVTTLIEVAPLLEDKHDFVGSSFALVALSLGLGRLGRFDEALAAAQRATDVAQHGDVIAKIDAMIAQSGVRSMRGDLEQAVPIAMQCTQLAEQSGATACVVASSFVLGDALMRQGKYGDAKIAFERGSTIADVTEQKIFRPSITAYLRATAASLGDFSLGGRTFDEALEEARSVGDRWGETHVIWKRADTEAQNADGDVGQMLADYETAAANFEAMEARPFLARALRDWGDALARLGRGDEARDKRQRAFALFEQMGIQREADEMRVLLG